MIALCYYYYGDAKYECRMCGHVWRMYDSNPLICRPSMKCEKCTNISSAQDAEHNGTERSTISWIAMISWMFAMGKCHATELIQISENFMYHLRTVLTFVFPLKHSVFFFHKTNKFASQLLQWQFSKVVRFSFQTIYTAACKFNEMKKIYFFFCQRTKKNIIIHYCESK